MGITRELLISVAALLLAVNGSLADENASNMPMTDSVTYPAQGGKGPGMGRDYQKNTPGPGQGQPVHRGGQSTDSAASDTTQSLPRTQQVDNVAIQALKSGVNEGTKNDRDLLRAAAVGDAAALTTVLQQSSGTITETADKSGRTALMLASAGGHIGIVNILLGNGASINHRDQAGHTALNWAAMRGRTQVASALLEMGADINTRNNEGVSPLLYAIGTRNIAMVNVLVANGADLEVQTQKFKVTPLLLAIEQNDIELINILLENGANVNGTNGDNYSPLMAAAESGLTGIAKMLLARGADVNAVDSKGRTAIMLATETHNRDVANVLLENGAEEIADKQS
jgi:ankyrin repeat protein